MEAPSHQAGDGTTTATVLAQAIVREGAKAVAAGHTVTWPPPPAQGGGILGSPRRDLLCHHSGVPRVNRPIEVVVLNSRHF